MQIRYNQNDIHRRLLAKYTVKLAPKLPNISHKTENIPAKFVRSASEEGRAILQTNYQHCFYCGYTPSVFDHFPPKKITEKGFLFPCCIQCNTIASNRFAFDIEGRISYIKNRLKKLLEELPITNAYSKDTYIERIKWNPRNFQIDFNIIKNVTKIISEDNETFNSIKNLKFEKIPGSIVFGKITNKQAIRMFEPRIENDLFGSYLKKICLNDLFR
jgi:hypothetical protein